MLLYYKLEFGKTGITLYVICNIICVHYIVKVSFKYAILCSRGISKTNFNNSINSKYDGVREINNNKSSSGKKAQ